MVTLRKANTPLVPIKISQSYFSFELIISVIFVLIFLKPRKDRAVAVDILVKDLRVFSAFNEDLFKEITQLLTLENFRYRNNGGYWFPFRLLSVVVEACKILNVIYYLFIDIIIMQR